MPSRTAEASKAVRKAWQREQELVQVGKGTRDWNEEQQQDIWNMESHTMMTEKPSRDIICKM